MHVLTVLLALATAAGASIAAAQSIEQRAAQVRQTLQDRAAEVRRTIESPPPAETVIDLGTRVIGQPPTGPLSTSTNPTDSRLTGGGGLPLAPGFNERMNRLFTGAVPGVRFDQPNAKGVALIADPQGAARLGNSLDLGAHIGMRNYAPGILVIRRANDGQVTGASNLFTGNSPTPGLVP